MPCSPLDDFWHHFPLGLTSIDEPVSSLMARRFRLLVVYSSLGSTVMVL
jgi:hypothetical protein